MTSLPLRVLVADPSDSSAERILRALAEGGFAVSSARVNSSEAVRVALAEGEWRLVVLCTHLPEFSTAVLADLRAGNPDLPFLVVVAPQHHELAAQLTQCSLDDCLVSEHLPLLCSRVRRLLEVARLRRDLRAAEASRDRERAIGARFRTLVEKSHNACVVLDREGTIVYASPACEPMGGRSASEYIGQRMHAWIHPDDLSASAGHWAELIARPGGVSLGLARFRRADGSWRYVESTNTNLLDDPDVRGVVANFRDVTERVEAEEQRRQIADELAHASSLLHAVANHTTDAIFVKDRAGKYLLFNQAAARFVGRPVEAVLGRDDAALFDADSARLVMERDRQIMDSGELLSAEEELTAAGATRVYHATKSPYRDAHGNVIGLIGISRDITERKRFEEALQASEERYRAVVEDQTETVCRVRADGSFIFANQAFCRLVGKSPGEVATLRGSEVAHPDDLARVQAALATLSPANPIVRVENRLRDSKGESRWLEFVNQGFFDPAGKLVELQAIGRDITERRRAEEALRASEERYRTLLHCIPDPLFVYDEETLSYLAANDAAVNTYGYSREELLGMTILDLRPPEDIPCLLAMLERSPGGLEARGAWRHRKKDGSLIYVDITAHHILVDGRRACIVLARDITGRREAEEALRTSEERLRLAMDATGLGTYDWDLTSGTLRWDARARAILGVGPEETPSLDLHYGRLHPDDRPRIAAARQAALAPQGDGAFRTEYRVMQPNGAVRWVASEGRVAFEGAGADRRPVRFIGTLLDVTESKRAGAALRESEERFRAFMDNCPAAAFVKDDAGRLLYVNAAWRRQFDPAPADWLGRSEADFWPSEVAAAFRESDQRCLVHGPQQLEESGRLPSTGEWRSWLVLKFPLGAEGARRVGGMAWDITDRKRAEQALQESEERFRQLADAMPQIVWAARPDGFHKYFNSQWYAYTGLSRSRAHGHGWDAALHPEDRTLTRQKWRHSLATGEPYEIECRFRRHDGEYRWFLVRALPQPAANGAVARWFGTCTDIHDFKNAEVLLRDKEAKLAEAVRIAQMGYWARDLTTG
ncbi:MAG: hypothetical protein K0Q72_1671, partial [Armatimonadetes bacterium]|nr:hypothetical protein [Armatimonadota bacterium]